MVSNESHGSQRDNDDFTSQLALVLERERDHWYRLLYVAPKYEDSDYPTRLLGVVPPRTIQ